MTPAARRSCSTRATTPRPGEAWESFSLDSLDKAFTEYDDRVAISGNHDNGTFVNRYLEKRGWTHLDGKAVTPFADVRITGVDDPRSSGLGNWRDEKGLTFDEVKERIADDVCAARRGRASGSPPWWSTTPTSAPPPSSAAAPTWSLGRPPARPEGRPGSSGKNGKAGYSYTNGTTGGAAYAIALGSKLRRDAEVTLVTYADGRPVGIQPVTVLTTGEIVVAPYVPLDLG